VYQIFSVSINVFLKNFEKKYQSSKKIKHIGLAKITYFSGHPGWQPQLIKKLIKFRQRCTKLFTTLLMFNPGKIPEFCKQGGGALKHPTPLNWYIKKDSIFFSSVEIKSSSVFGHHHQNGK
jgi:hypothetical protein